MPNIKEIKVIVSENLEKNFIENMRSVKHEMDLLNILICSFTDKTYSYDEYCRMRISFEMEACDNAVDFDYDDEAGMSGAEKLIVQNKALIKVMKDPGSEYEDIIEEEEVKWKLDKFHRLDKKLYSQISKYSSMRLIQEKLSFDVWKDKKEYFSDICTEKANKIGEETANENREMHEELIRTSMI
jgi:hypothetical protein